MDESADSEQTPQQPTSQPTLNILCFLFVKSEEKVSDLSPFANEKSIQSTAGHSKGENQETSSWKLKRKLTLKICCQLNIFYLKVKIGLRTTLKSCKVDLGPCTEYVLFRT